MVKGLSKDLKKCQAGFGPNDLRKIPFLFHNLRSHIICAFLLQVCCETSFFFPSLPSFTPPFPPPSLVLSPLFLSFNIKVTFNSFHLPETQFKGKRKAMNKFLFAYDPVEIMQALK